jgi:hypothetical protein
MNKMGDTKSQYLDIINNMIYDLDKGMHKDVLDFIFKMEEGIKYTETKDVTLIDIGHFSIEQLCKLMHFLKSFK